MASGKTDPNKPDPCIPCGDCLHHALTTLRAIHTDITRPGGPVHLSHNLRRLRYGHLARIVQAQTGALSQILRASILHLERAQNDLNTESPIPGPYDASPGGPPPAE